MLPVVKRGLLSHTPTFVNAPSALQRFWARHRAGTPAAVAAPRPLQLQPAVMAFSASAAAGGGGGSDIVSAKKAVRKEIIRTLKALGPEAMALQSAFRRGADGGGGHGALKAVDQAEGCPP
jgi:hypothetical protein